MYILILALLIVVGGSFYWNNNDNLPKKDTSEVRSSSTSDITPYINTKLSLDKLFDAKQDIPEEVKQKSITLIATGDVMLGRMVNVIATQKNDFTYPYHLTREELKAADIALINLENPITEKCPLKTDGMVFCADSRHIEGFKYAQIDVLNLANNHIGNYRVEGIEYTKKILDDNGFVYSGINNIGSKQVKGSNIAFLGFNDVPPRYDGAGTADEDQIVKLITNAKKNHDFIVVSVHFGEEYRYQPTDRQREVAHLLIDSGADLVIGNHPHWFQSIEVYNDKLIAYSHGNFIFDQDWSEETKTGIVGKYTIYENKVIDVEFLPVYIAKTGQPMFLEDQRKNKVIEILKSESLKLIQ